MACYYTFDIGNTWHRTIFGNKLKMRIYNNNNTTYWYRVSSIAHRVLIMLVKDTVSRIVNLPKAV